MKDDGTNLFNYGPIQPAPGKVRILVVDRDDKFLRWVSPEYANLALERAEVERTDRLGVVRVARRDDVDFVPLNGHGKVDRTAKTKGKR